MWLLGLVLLILGFVFAVHFLVWIGIVLLVLGLIVFFAPARTNSRRWYW